MQVKAVYGSSRQTLLSSLFLPFLASVDVVDAAFVAAACGVAFDVVVAIDVERDIDDLIDRKRNNKIDR